ncbi:MAG TPA: hypothetical protein VK176_07035 [Phycisphaerales bacterium]|nr:hypothetical protein [Phycisphaerales bacterium]
MRFHSIAFITLFTAAPLAHAGLTSLDLANPGDGLLTLDSTTGLRWLDLTQTRNFSYNAMELELQPGGLFDGFRRASAAEVDVLFTSAGMMTRGWDPTLTPAINNLLTLNGTLDNNFRIGSDAFTSDVFGLGHAITSHFIAPNEGPSAYAFAVWNGSGVDWYSSNELGHWLVQVPAPGSAALASLSGLLLARRRRA